MKRPLLDISSLHVTIKDKEILKGIGLHINEGEVHVLFGPNGSGKSTLLSSIMKLPDFTVSRGEINFEQKNLVNMETDEIARLGIALSFQHPPAVHGVSLGKFLNRINNSPDLEDAIDQLGMRKFLDRDLNSGFSGGELKRAEILKLYAQNPKLVLIDEPESGVDLDNIAIIAKAVNNILNNNQGKTFSSRSALIITHTGHILDYIDAHAGHMIIDGKIVYSGDPRRIMKLIKADGFEGAQKQLKEEGVNSGI